MIRLAADEDFDNDILRGLKPRSTDIDLVRAQDAGFSGATDPTILEWAAREARVLLTHDSKTMRDFAYDRVAVGLPMLASSW